MEDYLTGRLPNMKMTSPEYDLTGRWPNQKMTSSVYDLTGRLPHQKITSLENELTRWWPNPIFQDVHPKQWVLIQSNKNVFKYNNLGQWYIIYNRFVTEYDFNVGNHNIDSLASVVCEHIFALLW